jgi:hypothetical protein
VELSGFVFSVCDGMCYKLDEIRACIVSFFFSHDINV